MNQKWKRVPIKSVYHGLYDGPHATPKPSAEGPVFLGIKNLTDDGHFDFSEIRHIAEEDYPKWTRRIEPRENDIVFTYEATLNRYALIPPGFRGCLGRRLALIRPDTSKVDPTFLFLYMFSEDWRRTIASKMIQGATVDRIPLIQFPDFPISLPDFPTQRKIAGILSAYDDLIENNTRRIAILEEMAQALYREWFVRFRFPGHENVPLVPSPLGDIPQGWNVVKVEDAVHINPRTTVPRDGEKHFVSMGAVPHNTLLIDTSLVEMRTGNSGSKFKNGDTLFARITPCLENGKTAFVQFLPSDDDVAFGSTEFIVLRSKTVGPEFVYLLARSDPFRDNAIKSMSGATGRQRVQERCFDKYLLAHPDQATLGAFSSIVQPMFQAVFTLARKNENLRRTRDLLLPKLISGQLDVEHLDIDTGADLVEALG